jgi:hypothetical protein
MRLITKKFTLVGVAQSLDYFSTYNERPKAIGLKNDDTANTIVVTVQGALEDGTVDVLPGEYVKMAGEFSKISCLGTGTLRTFACDDIDGLPDVENSALSGTVPAGSLSADATGRARMAAAFFGAGVAASIAHFADAFFTAAFVAAKFVAGSIDPTKLAIKTFVALGAGNTAPTAAQLLGGVMTVAPAAPQTCTTPVAALIIAALVGQVAGSWFDFVIVNVAGNTATLTAGDVNVTIVGTAAIATGTSGSFRCMVTGAGTVSIIRL